MYDVIELTFVSFLSYLLWWRNLIGLLRRSLHYTSLTALAYDQFNGLPHLILLFAIFLRSCPWVLQELLCCRCSMRTYCLNCSLLFFARRVLSSSQVSILGPGAFLSLEMLTDLFVNSPSFITSSPPWFFLQVCRLQPDYVSTSRFLRWAQQSRKYVRFGPYFFFLLTSSNFHHRRMDYCQVTSIPVGVFTILSTLQSLFVFISALCQMQNVSCQPISFICAYLWL